MLRSLRLSANNSPIVWCLEHPHWSFCAATVIPEWKHFCRMGRTPHSLSPARDHCCHPADSFAHSQNDCMSLPVYPSRLQSILPLWVPVQSRHSMQPAHHRQSPTLPSAVFRYHELASCVLPPNYTLSLNQPVWFLFPLYLERSLTLSHLISIPSIAPWWCLDVIRQLFKSDLQLIRALGHKYGTLNFKI